MCFLTDTFSSIISQDIYSNRQHIEDCPFDCNLAEITLIRDLPGQFGACAQQCESGLLAFWFKRSSILIFKTAAILDFQSE